MCIRLGQELYAAEPGQFAETVDHFRSVDLHLLQGCARDGKGDFEFPPTLADHLHNGAVGRQIACIRDAAEDLFVLKIVVVIMVVADVKEAVAP